MNHLVKIISRRATIHLIFLFTLISLTIYTFYPIVKINFGEWEWMELEYYLKDIPPHASHLLFWLKFYLTDQYGPTYALIGLSGLIFKGWMSGYYIMNVFLRIIASISIYLFVNWWTKRFSGAFFAGIFFALAVSGIANTIWVIQFVAYIAVILLILTLYFWKRFHDNPTSKNLKASAIFFALTIFIAHVRLHALPFIIFLGEIYSFFQRSKNDIYVKLRKHHLIILLLIFLAMYFISSGLHITSQVLKTIPPVIIIKSLVNGYPPIIHSFFLFIGNLILPSTVINYLNPYTEKFLNFGNLGNITLIICSICLIPFFINLIKGKFLPTFVSLLAVIYPLSFFYISNGFQWEPFRLSSTSISGAVFFLIILMIIELKKEAPKLGELALLGFIIMISHLFLPWLAFPQAESNVQAAYTPDHRYYTIPLVGLSFIWAAIFPYFWDNLRIHKSFFKVLISVVVVLLFLALLVGQRIATRNLLIERVQHFPKNRDMQLWDMIKPIFANFEDKKRERVVFMEGDLSEKDKIIVLYLLRHHLINELGYGKPGNKYNVTFIIDKEILKRIFEKDPSLFQQYNLPASFSETDFMAFRVNENHLEDITKDVLREVKSTK